MRPATITTILFVVLFNTANAQLSLIPQIGLENTSASIHFNGNAVLPAGPQLSPSTGMRLEYQFKKLHGPYLGISTSRSTVDYSFTDPENGMNIYQAKAGDMKLRLEAGYQVSTKPIYFKNSSSSKSTKAATPFNYYHYYSYGGRCSHSCGRSYATKPGSQPTEKGMYMALQPSVGAAYIPSVGPDVFSETESGITTYHYMAGNWNTAVVAGLNVEFGKNTQKAFNIGIQYIKGVGNLGTKTLTSMSGAKEHTTTLSSDASGWNLKAGIPITLGKKKPQVKPEMRQVPPPPPPQERRCQQYHKCSKVVI